MQSRTRSTDARTEAEREAENREFWADDRSDDGSEPRKAAFAGTVTKGRRWLRNRRHP
jgi:hypothetical protein